MSDQVSTYIAPQNVQTTTPKAMPVIQSLPAMLMQPVSLDSLQSLSRPITLNVDIINLLQSGQMDLKTQLGNFAIQINQPSSDFFQALNNLITMNFKDAQKPIFELMIQAGTPPKEAMLLIKSKDKNLFVQTTKNDASFNPQQKIGPPFFTKGQTLTISALPKDVKEQNILQPQPTKLEHTQTKPLVPESFSKAVHIVKEKGTELIQNFAPKTEAKVSLEHIAAKPHTVEKAPLPIKNSQIQVGQIIPPFKETPQLTPKQIVAEVIGKTLSGQTVIKNEGQSFVIETKGTLPTGTKLIVTPLPASTHHDLPLALTQSEQTVQKLMEQLSATVQNTIPNDAQVVALAQKIPTLRQNMTGTMLFLFNAIQGNKIEEWMGTGALSKLSVNARRRSIESLSKAFQERAVVSNEATGSEWRSWALPIHNNGAFETLRFYVRDDKKEHTSDMLRNDDKRYTRFVISLTASQLGHMQIDGLSQPNKLDLIVRSEKTLPENLIQELRQASHNIYEATGLTGSINFQENGENWIRFKDDEALGVSV